MYEFSLLTEGQEFLFYIPGHGVIKFIKVDKDTAYTAQMEERTHYFGQDTIVKLITL